MNETIKKNKFNLIQTLSEYIDTFLELLVYILLFKINLYYFKIFFVCQSKSI